MKIFCMSDIHGCLAEFEEALSLVIEHLEKPETMLILMGDYIHGGSDNYGVLDKIIKLQNRYGSDKVLALTREPVTYGNGELEMKFLLESIRLKLEK